MTRLDRPLRVPLTAATGPVWGSTQRHEPTRIGVPLPKGAARSPVDISLESEDGRPCVAQVRPLDHWSDGSLRWALIDFQADATAGRADGYVLRVGPGEAAAPLQGGIQISEHHGRVDVDTGAARFSIAPGGAFPFSQVTSGGAAVLDHMGCRLVLARDGRDIEYRAASVTVQDRGPLRVELSVQGAAFGDATFPLDVSARIELYAGTAIARVLVTIRNPRRAEHPSGIWELGDAGSVLLDAATLVLTVVDHAVLEARCAAEIGHPLGRVDLPFEIYQESSGGACWNSPTHQNRDGLVPLRWRGYRARAGAVERIAERASPIVEVVAESARVALAIPEFWQNFPRAVTVRDRTIEVGLFPGQFGNRHELQGGEQKTHEVVLAFGVDSISTPPLAWVHDPLRYRAPPAFHGEAGAVPFLVPADLDPNVGYRALVENALDASRGFVAKREAADEFGWRHYGDIYADHESAFQPADRPFVSHYNNQYDAVAGFAIQFFRTGDDRWWRLMDELARHVRDIDIYHTRADRACYNSGLFWHTQHYVDAGTSTHRTYPSGTSGGGPANEHNYNAGLMLHYFLTGDRASRDAAVALGRWVIDMDDGRLTPFRWIAPVPTGNASFTVDYHGPGRGAGHSILACLVARRLTGDAAYDAKAAELIRRCVHPADDIAARHLLNAERRWSYTAFLQALGVYLHDAAERGRLDETYAYAQASLLHYARWMAQHERHYLDHAAELEYPTETWAAQEMRKVEVFLWAALHAEGAERATFLERAHHFFDYAVETLQAMPGRVFARPLVLLLSHGVRLGWFDRHAEELAEPVVAGVHARFGSPGPPFEGQKAIAIRRAMWVAGLGAVSAVGVLGWWLFA